MAYVGSYAEYAAYGARTGAHVASADAYYAANPNAPGAPAKSSAPAPKPTPNYGAPTFAAQKTFLSQTQPSIQATSSALSQAAAQNQGQYIGTYQQYLSYGGTATEAQYNAYVLATNGRLPPQQGQPGFYGVHSAPAPKTASRPAPRPVPVQQPVAAPAPSMQLPVPDTTQLAPPPPPGMPQGLPRGYSTNPLLFNQSTNKVTSGGYQLAAQRRETMGRPQSNLGQAASSRSATLYR